MRLSRLALKVFAPVVLMLTLPASAAINLSTTTPSVEAFDIGSAATAALPADFKVDRPAGVRNVGSYASALANTTHAGGGRGVHPVVAALVALPFRGEEANPGHQLHGVDPGTRARGGHVLEQAGGVVAHVPH